ncbi:unnamed protein product [Adineta steineri]|uniref:HAT C-terminal dimerisation domain-containing protein n=1 Tax=Adineta steineri TaxID=433720 RepID=A0A813VJ99_9BILA|nr:unnamed protein product [Adineta steineri]CAF3987275.1 unnamed protein product [Adineta steineri]
MIDLHELLSSGSDDDTPNTNLISPTVGTSNERSSNIIKYDVINIKRLLKDEPTKYTLVENLKVNHIKPAPCWQKFGLPAIKNENDRNVIIKNFASCKSCFSTYVYTHGSTKSLNSHKCSKEVSSTSPMPSNKSPSLCSKNSPLFIAKKKQMTSLIASWVCQNMRPLSIVEDEGFVNIIQKCLRWNNGAFSNINGNEILASRWSISREISRQANDIRQRIGGVLRTAAEQGFLAISPDLWSDKFKQHSYLGLTAHFVDERHILHSIELCCEPYNEINKRAPSVRKVAITFALSKFGLDNLMNKITFVCDRGSNLVKALEDYEVVHCFPHRLNNVLKRTFYSAGTQDKVERKKKKQSSNKNQHTTHVTWNNFATDDDDLLMDYDDRDSSESECEYDDVPLDEKSVELALRSLSSSPERDHMNVVEKDLPPYAAQVLAIITRCKQLCCYVKRVNWNPLLQELSKPTIKQEVIVRWLTMSQLLESILASYSSLTNIAGDKGVLHTLPSIDIASVGAITALFAPWKNVIERVQTTTTSSLHLVVTSYWYLLESLIVTRDEAADKTAQGIVFFKRRARQLLKAMFNLHDLHWIAATLNPRTRMLKLATESERTHTYDLIHAELSKIIQMNQANDVQAIQPPVITSSSPASAPHKKFKSYTAHYDDELDCSESSKNVTTSMYARRELEIYLQMKLSKCMNINNEDDDPLIFWQEQESILPNLSKLAKRIFCIPASSAAVERTFSSAGNIISQRRSSLNPSLVNDMILVRSASSYLNA